MKRTYTKQFILEQISYWSKMYYLNDIKYSKTAKTNLARWEKKLEELDR